MSNVSLFPASPTHTALSDLGEYTDQINALLGDDAISDIMVNGYNHIFVEKDGVMRDAGFVFRERNMVMAFAEQIIRLCGRERSVKDNTVIEGMLPDGSRVSVVLPPIAVDGPSISIRKFPKTMITLEDMVTKELVPAHIAQFLKAATTNRLNIIISGNTSSGKTTLLNALSEHIGESERVVTIEDTPELRLQHRNVVRMETNPDGDATVTASSRELVKCAMRMRPDRIVIGEMRGSEAFELLQAVNTGHYGSMATLHANSPRDAMTRLEHMIGMADVQLSSRAIRHQIVGAIDMVIQTRRDEKGRRRISHVTEVIGMEGDVIVAQDLFVLHPMGDYRWANVTSRNPRTQKVIEETMVKSAPPAAKMFGRMNAAA